MSCFKMTIELTCHCCQKRIKYSLFNSMDKGFKLKTKKDILDFIKNMDCFVYYAKKPSEVGRFYFFCKRCSQGNHALYNKSLFISLDEYYYKLNKKEIEK